MIVLSQREVPQVDKEAINRRKQKRLAKAITNEDKGLNNFGITKKIQKENKKAITKGRRGQRVDRKRKHTKRRHELASLSNANHQVTIAPNKQSEEISTTQKLKDLRETDYDNDDNVQLALRKSKVTQRQASPASKTARVTKAAHTAKKPIGQKHLLLLKFQEE